MPSYFSGNQAAMSAIAAFSVGVTAIPRRSLRASSAAAVSVGSSRSGISVSLSGVRFLDDRTIQLYRNYRKSYKVSIGTLHDRIGWAMARRGWSVADLARALSEAGHPVKHQVVGPWATGDSKPGGRYLEALPEVLGVSGHWLLTGKGPIEPPGEPPNWAAALAAAVEQGRNEVVESVIAAMKAVGRINPGASSAEEARSLMERAEATPPPDGAAALPRRGLPRRRRAQGE